MSTTDATRRRAFTAIRAVVALNALIDRGDRRRALLLMAFGFVATLFDVVALLLIVPLVTTLSTGTLPWYLAGPDAVITLPQWAADHPVVAIGGMCALLFIIRAVLGTLQLWWSAGVAHRAEVDLIWRLLRGSATMSYSAQLDQESGSMFRAVTDSVVRVMNLLGNGLSAAGDLILTIGIAAVIIAVNPIVGGMLIVYFVAAYFYFFISNPLVSIIVSIVVGVVAGWAGLYRCPSRGRPVSENYRMIPNDCHRNS